MWTEDYVMAVMHEREQQARGRRGHHVDPRRPGQPSRGGWLRRLRQPSRRTHRRRTAHRPHPIPGK